MFTTCIQLYMTHMCTVQALKTTKIGHFCNVSEYSIFPGIRSMLDDEENVTI